MCDKIRRHAKFRYRKDFRLIETALVLGEVEFLDILKYGRSSFLMVKEFVRDT